jgi:hypothetical protein
MREFLAQSVGSKKVSLQNIAMNFCGGWSCFIGKNTNRRFKKSMHAREKLAQVFYWHPICGLTA